MDTETERLRGFKIRLEKELAELENMRAADSERTAPVALDQQGVGRVSRIDALQMQAMSQSIQRRRQQRLAQLRQALKRIEDDEFGLCQECGEAIAAARLNIDPAFARCVRCQR